jgi:hypothetical protein
LLLGGEFVLGDVIFRRQQLDSDWMILPRMIRTGFLRSQWNRKDFSLITDAYNVPMDASWEVWDSCAVG